MIPTVLFFLGLCVGSFLNVVISRIPKGESVLWGRSHCDHCKHQLYWYELIPLISYMMQKGKSRCCKKSLSCEHPFIEMATGVGFVFLYIAQSPSFLQLFSMFQFLISLVLFCAVLIMVVSDWKTEIIPVVPMIVSIVSAFAFRFFPVIYRMNFRADMMQGGIHFFMNYGLSAFFAWLFFFCLWFFSKGKAMGDGDMYVALMMGLCLGFPHIIVALYAAFLTGAVVGVILILGRKKSLKAHIPFGPFLIWGFVVGIVWGDVILRMWRTLL